MDTDHKPVFSTWNTMCDEYTLDSMRTLLYVTRNIYALSSERRARLNELQFGSLNGNIVVNGLTDNFILSRPAMEQICKYLDAPLEFLTGLKAQTVAIILNEALHSLSPKALPQIDIIVVKEEVSVRETKLVVRGFREKKAYSDCHLIQLVDQVCNRGTGWDVFEKPTWSERGFSFKVVQDKPCMEIVGYPLHRGLHFMGYDIDYKRNSVRTFLHNGRQSIIYTEDRLFEQLVKKQLLVQLNGQAALLFGALQQYGESDMSRERLMLEIATSTSVPAETIKKLAEWLSKHGLPTGPAVNIAQRMGAVHETVNLFKLLLFAGGNKDTRDHTAKLLETLTRTPDNSSTHRMS